MKRSKDRVRVKTEEKDLEEVATHIQAGYKGMMAREEYKETDLKLVDNLDNTEQEQCE